MCDGGDYFPFEGAHGGPRENRGVILRLAQPADAPALMPLIRLSFEATAPQVYGRRQIESALPVVKLDPELINRGRLLVAAVDGRLAACGGWSTGGPLVPGVPGPLGSRIPAAGIRAEIRCVYVHPAYQRRGIGRALMERIETMARHAGSLSFALVATRQSVPFYLGCGYEALDEIDLPLPGGSSIPAVFMHKTV